MSGKEYVSGRLLIEYLKTENDTLTELYVAEG